MDTARRELRQVSRRVRERNQYLQERHDEMTGAEGSRVNQSSHRASLPVTNDHLEWNASALDDDERDEPAKLGNKIVKSSLSMKRRRMRDDAPTASSSSHPVPDWLQAIVRRGMEVMSSDDNHNVERLAWPIVNVRHERKDSNTPDSEKTSSSSYSRIMDMSAYGVELPIVIPARTSGSTARQMATLAFSSLRYPLRRAATASDPDNRVQFSRNQVIGIVLYDPRRGRSFAYRMSYVKNPTSHQNGRSAKLPDHSIRCVKHGKLFKGDLSQVLSHKWPVVE